MTVFTETARVDYVGTGAVATFDYTFKIYDEPDLLVTKRVTATGVETTLAYPADYSVTGVGDEDGGTFTLTGGVLDSGYTLTARSHTTITQETDLRNQGGYYPEVVEDALDRGARIDQQQQDQINRSIKFGETASGVSGLIQNWLAGAYLRVALNGLYVEAVSAVVDAGNYLASGVGAVLRPILSKLADTVSVKDYGAVGDGVTDDLAAFNTALAAAYASNRSLYIPSIAPGKYYKLSNAWTITDKDSVTIFGDGTSSLLVIANASGANCITLNSTIHATIRDIGIYGTAGSGHGIELTNGSHLNKFRGIWIGWVDGDGFKFTSGQSNILTDCDCDQNIGYRPATLVGGLTDGSMDRAFHVPYNAAGDSNNQSLVNCRSNACGAVASLQVGGAGGSVDTFSMVGGILQGASTYKEFDVRVRDGRITNVHIEPPIGATANYVGTIDRCTNFVVTGAVLAGDVNFNGACYQSGLIGVRGAGVNASNAAGSIGCFVRDGQYKNISTGPVGGAISDPYGVLDTRNMINAGNEYVRTGDNTLGCPAEYSRSSFEEWLGGASPTIPAGLSQVGGTLTRDSSVVKDGTYSAKMVMSADQTQYLSVPFGPLEQIRGKTITVEVWAYNLTTAALALVTGVITGGAAAGDRSEATYLANAWERVLVSFAVPADATGFGVRLTGSTGTVYWDRLSVRIDSFAPVKQLALANSGTPDVTLGGRMVPTVLTGGTTTITDFPDAHPGVPFTLLGRHSLTITHSATGIVAKGGANIAVASGTVTHFVRGLDTGYIYEI